MAYKRLGEQLEQLRHLITDDGAKPWKKNRKSNKYDKKLKHRAERRKAKIDPETAPTYGKYKGYEY